MRCESDLDTSFIKDFNFVVLENLADFCEWVSFVFDLSLKYSSRASYSLINWV